MREIKRMLQSHKLSCESRQGEYPCTCGRDAAESELAAMQARIEKLEVALAGDYCPSCTWRGNVTLVHGVCPYCEVDWLELKIKENEEK